MRIIYMFHMFRCLRIRFSTIVTYFVSRDLRQLHELHVLRTSFPQEVYRRPSVIPRDTPRVPRWMFLPCSPTTVDRTREPDLPQCTVQYFKFQQKDRGTQLLVFSLQRIKRDILLRVEQLSDRPEPTVRRLEESAMDGLFLIRSSEAKAV